MANGKSRKTKQRTAAEDRDSRIRDSLSRTPPKPKKKSYSERWSDKDNEYLRKCREEKPEQSYDKIALVIGRTALACRLHRHQQLKKKRAEEEKNRTPASSPSSRLRPLLPNDEIGVNGQPSGNNSSRAGFVSNFGAINLPARNGVAMPPIRSGAEARGSGSWYEKPDRSDGQPEQQRQSYQPISSIIEQGSMQYMTPYPQPQQQCTGACCTQSHPAQLQYRNDQRLNDQQRQLSYGQVLPAPWTQQADASPRDFREYQRVSQTYSPRNIPAQVSDSARFQPGALQSSTNWSQQANRMADEERRNDSLATSSRRVTINDLLDSA